MVKYSFILFSDVMFASPLNILVRLSMILCINTLRTYLYFIAQKSTRRKL
jgi:hypothetical protein